MKRYVGILVLITSILWARPTMKVQDTSDRKLHMKQPTSASLKHGDMNGNLSCSMWNNGFIGDNTGWAINYPSCWWPCRLGPDKIVNSYLYMGGVWVGARVPGDTTYEVARVENTEGFPSEFTPGYVYVKRPGDIAPIEVTAEYADTGAEYNFGRILNISIRAKSYQWLIKPCDNFFITEYWIKNIGNETLEKVYLGIYFDCDILTNANGSAYAYNFCGADTSRDLVWMSSDTTETQLATGVKPGYIGLRVLAAVDNDGTQKRANSITYWANGIDYISLTSLGDPWYDWDPSDWYNAYYSLSAGIKGNYPLRRENQQFIAESDSTVKIKIDYVMDITDKWLKEFRLVSVEGVWLADDTLHQGTNYFTGGSFDNTVVDSMFTIKLGTKLPSDTEKVIVSYKYVVESQSDWRIFISAGDFTIPPGESALVVIATCIGENLDSLLACSDVAQSVYNSGYTNVPIADNYAAIIGKCLRTDSVTTVPVRDIYMYYLENDTLKKVYAIQMEDGSYALPNVYVPEPVVYDSVTYYASSSLYERPVKVRDNLFPKQIHIWNAYIPHKYATIKGKLTKWNGEPIPGGLVKFRTYYDSTDENGEYYIEGIGTHYVDSVVAMAEDYETKVLYNIETPGPDSILYLDITLTQKKATGEMTWARKRAIPQALSCASYATAGGKIYIIGGYDPNGRLDGKVWEYNPKADTLNGSPWRERAPMPTPRYGLACAEWHDTIYTFGGVDDNYNYTDIVEAYLPDEDIWLTGYVTMPYPRAFHKAVTFRDKIYILGGRNQYSSGYYNVWEYDPRLNKWRILNDFPVRARGMLATPYITESETTIIAGCGRLFTDTLKKDYYKYDWVNDTWVKLTTSPKPVAYGELVQYGDNIYQIGGGILKFDGDYKIWYVEPIAGVYRYSPTQDSWHTVGEMLKPHAFFSAVGLSDGIYVISGERQSWRPQILTVVVEKGFYYGSISGQVVMQGTGTPVMGAKVYPYLHGNLSNWDATDDQGNFVVSKLEPSSDYKLEVIYERNDSVFSATITNFTVSPGKDTNVTIALSYSLKEIAEKNLYSYYLAGPMPNPAKGYMWIRYGVAQPGKIQLKVYDVTGRLVRILKNSYHQPGKYEVKWDATDRRGRHVAQGIFFIRLEAEDGKFVATQKAILLR